MLITTISVQEGKKFNLNQGMKGNIVKTHDGIVHEGMKQFKCDICNGKFRSKQIMLQQFMKKINSLLSYEICNINFGQKGNLKRHVATVHE